MGDTDQGWYVSQELLPIYRDRILPLAKFCVPNQVFIRIDYDLFIYLLLMLKCKDAGFVYESLQFETNRVIWDFCFHETNPRNESLRFGFANPDLRVRNLRICKDSDLRISIFKDSFRAIVLRIRKDSLDS